jgi:hypothetical protein
MNGATCQRRVRKKRGKSTIEVLSRAAPASGASAAADPATHPYLCAEGELFKPSLITCHTSHVTRHTSHVTRHTSHVTRHTSHVQQEPSIKIITRSSGGALTSSLFKKA